jgi:hypothetical protein
MSGRADMAPLSCSTVGLRFARGGGCVRLVCAAVIVWLAVAGAAAADPPSKEVWPEIDTWLRLSPAWRLSLFVPVSQNLETYYREGNLILQADYAWGQTTRSTRLLDENRTQTMKAWLVRGGYLGGKSLADDGAEYAEHTAFAELHLRLPLKGGILLSHRFRSDLRWLGDTDAEFSTRLRYRLLAEKEFTAGRGSIVPYVSVEPYFDSRYGTVNRVRAITGASVSWSRWTAIETNVTYQYDSRSSTKELFALNVILHVFFDASRQE